MEWGKFMIVFSNYIINKSLDQMFKIPDGPGGPTMLSLAEIGLALTLLGNKKATTMIQTKGIAIV